MSKLSSKEITEVLDVLIGETEPIGETNYDEKVLENLKTLIDVMNWCLDGVAYAQEYIHFPQHSIHQVGFTAQCAMQEWAEWLKERIEEE